MAYLLLLYKSGGDYPNGTIFWPKVGYTLVSIGQLDECGYLTTFGNGQCTISNKSSNIIGQVPCSQKAVYKVVHGGPELTCMAEDTVTWAELHHRLGHVSQGATKQLAEKGLVTGVCVDMSSGDVVFCGSCLYTEACGKGTGRVVGY